RTATDAEDEKTAIAFAHTRKFIHAFFDGRGVETGNDLLCLFEILLNEAHARRMKHERLSRRNTKTSQIDAAASKECANVSLIIRVRFARMPAALASPFPAGLPLPGKQLV